MRADRECPIEVRHRTRADLDAILRDAFNPAALRRSTRNEYRHLRVLRVPRDVARGTIVRTQLSMRAYWYGTGQRGGPVNRHQATELHHVCPFCMTEHNKAGRQ